MTVCEYWLLSSSYCAQCRYSDFLKSVPLNTPNEHIPCKECVAYEFVSKPLDGHNMPLMFEPIQARDIGLKYE